MTTELNTLVSEAEAAITQATELTALDQVRVAVLGKKGALTAILKTLGSMEPEARKETGAAVNRAKQALLQKNRREKGCIRGGCTQ